MLYVDVDEADDDAGGQVEHGNGDKVKADPTDGENGVAGRNFDRTSLREDAQQLDRDSDRAGHAEGYGEIAVQEVQQALTEYGLGAVKLSDDPDDDEHVRKRRDEEERAHQPSVHGGLLFTQLAVVAAGSEKELHSYPLPLEHVIAMSPLSWQLGKWFVIYCV